MIFHCIPLCATRYVLLNLDFVFKNIKRCLIICEFINIQAAEALGAIGLERNAPLLKNSLVSDPAQEVRETCELALSRIDGLKNTSVTETSPFLSVDPAAPAASSSVEELRWLFYRNIISSCFYIIWLLYQLLYFIGKFY